MAKAKKLPSGSWRCLVYSHTEKVMDDLTKVLVQKWINDISAKVSTNPFRRNAT